MFISWTRPLILDQAVNTGPFMILSRRGTLICGAVALLEGTRTWQAELSLADLRAIALKFIELIECHVEAA